MRENRIHNLPYEKVGDEIHCLSELAPFEIPNTWEWCRVGDLFYNASGLSYKKDLLAKKSDSMVRVLRGGNIGDESYFFKEDDVFISNEYVKPELFLKKNYMITPAVSSIEHIGKIALVEQDYADVVVGGFVLMLMPYFSDDVISQYLLYAFAAKNHRDNCRNITHKSGQAFYNLSREKLMNLPISLPPHNEMIRILEILKTVLPIVADYSVKEQDIRKLNIDFLDLLKKSILQEAVQGKLVPQDPDDEPASVLLERIRAEKEQLIKTGKIKRDKHESVIFRRDNCLLLTNNNASLKHIAHSYQLFRMHKILIMRSWTETSAVSMMRYRLISRKAGYGHDLDKLFLCFREPILSLKNTTILKKEHHILLAPAAYQRTAFY